MRQAHRRVARRLPGLAVLSTCAILVLGLCACSSSGGGSGGVKAAEAAVSAKQKAASDAEAELAAKAAAFCKSSATYVTALDRYGDVINQSAPTVGNVKDAGRDLTQPREDALSAAQAAATAQGQLVTAKNELAQAESALASAHASASGRPAPTAVPNTATAAPLAPSATVNRVKQADKDFATAQQGITDATPLTQASQQFNAAVVALEMSWLRLFADADCLTDDQQKRAEAAVRDYTVALQKSLSEAGYYKGDVDGVYGPTTVDAVEALQKAHGLPVTGTVDRATDAALQADLQKKGGVAAQEKLTSTAAVQQTLKLAGFWDGPVDGDWTPQLTDALKAFQTELGVKPTGTVDAATIAALEDAVAKGKTAGESGAPSSSTSTRSVPSTRAPTSGSPSALRASTSETP